MFGGERRKLKDQRDAVKYGDVWVLAQKDDATPSGGHAIDHIGWHTTMGLAAEAAELRAKGVRFTTEPQSVRNIHMSYVEGPAAVKVELLQRYERLRFHEAWRRSEVPHLPFATAMNIIGSRASWRQSAAGGATNPAIAPTD